MPHPEAEPTQQPCAVCNQPLENPEAGAEVRLYLGPGDRLAALWLPLCTHHVERFRIARDLEVIECRIGGIEPRRPPREAER